mmetsp:Transcript_6330/g.15546  ORF Transcript_6330/g.15546 Transcript_6330/m.15546 type:complete len:80 (-) Transcript_6330:619-858(-)
MIPSFIRESYFGGRITPSDEEDPMILQKNLLFHLVSSPFRLGTQYYVHLRMLDMAILDDHLFLMHSPTLLLRRVILSSC